MKSNNALQIELCGMSLRNPLILASGILGVVPSTMVRLAETGIGAVTSKSIGPSPRKGYGNPSVIEISKDTLLNSVGLANPGIDEFVKEIEEFKSRTDIPLFVSVFGGDPDLYANIAGRCVDAGADAVELNISCPHAEVSAIGASPELTEIFTKTVKSSVKKPVFVKMTPNVTDIVASGIAAQKGGADAVVAINTVKGLAIDIETGYPLLSHGIGGLSGRAIKPIGLRCVFELAKSKKITIPIIGCGGIFDWRDVIEYLMAGATCVQIGSAFMKGVQIIPEILLGLEKYLESHGLQSLYEIRGKSLNISLGELLK
jgi:dihydroorotate dehydrogenase (NAD+) catalytic subunit